MRWLGERRQGREGGKERQRPTEWKEYIHELKYHVEIQNRKITVE